MRFPEFAALFADMSVLPQLIAGSVCSLLAIGLVISGIVIAIASYRRRTRHSDSKPEESQSPQSS